LFVLKGITAVQEFNGMFAIAIWDTLKEQLTLIRDRFGVKPIYYYRGPEGFAFASELKSLLELPIHREINKEALSDYLFLEYIPKPNTIFKNISKMPNGHYAEVNASNNLHINSYYDVREKYNPKSISEDTALEELQSILSSSVNYRMISDVPVGAFLSGGVDSSLVVAKFQENSVRAVETFTIGFDVARFDESSYAKQVAEILHTNHHEFRLSADSMFSILQDAVEYYDEPFAVSSVLPSLLVSESTRKYATVALSGDGGDELFMGYNVYTWYKRIADLKRIGGKASLALAGKLLSVLGVKAANKSRLFSGWNDKYPFIQLWSQEQQMFTQLEIGSLLNTNYKHQTTVQYWEELEKEKLSDMQRVSFFDIQYYLADDLMYKMDIASMRHSLEVRCPFLDYRLVEFAINLPQQLKIKQNEQKYLLKKALEKYIPKELIYRKKWGFPAPVEEWLKDSHKELIDYYLSEERIKSQDIFNSKEIKKIIDAFRSGNYYHNKRIWALIIFQLWYDKYMVKEPVQSIY
jgi:asparagine synthase (glutamine-hydrolysing)